jgi:VIT1/CCC1 family predicted Fe2+/Mn2+ transporter
MSDVTRARPIQAALASAAAFATGALPPVILTMLLPLGSLTVSIVASSLVLLAVLGATAARTGGAPVVIGAARVAFWGAVAMACTALVGRLFGTAAATANLFIWSSGHLII